MRAVGLGTLFAVPGNVLLRARPNWSFDIRTPWTLDNRRAWERTHRVGGMLFIVAGLLTIAAGVMVRGGALQIMLAALLGASVVAVVFSYFAWRHETRR